MVADALRMPLGPDACTVIGVACPMVLTGVGRSIVGAAEQPTKMAMGRIASGDIKEMTLRTSHSRSARLWIVRGDVSERVTFVRRLFGQKFQNRAPHQDRGGEICNHLVARTPPTHTLHRKSLESASCGRSVPV